MFRTPADASVDLPIGLEEDGQTLVYPHKGYWNKLIKKLAESRAHRLASVNIYSRQRALTDVVENLNSAASLGLSIRIRQDVFSGPHRCPLVISSSANRKRRSVSPFRRSHWQKERDAIRKAKQRVDFDPNSDFLVRTTAEEIRTLASGVDDE